MILAQNDIVKDPVLRNFVANELQTQLHSATTVVDKS